MDQEDGLRPYEWCRRDRLPVNQKRFKGRSSPSYVKVRRDNLIDYVCQ